MSTLRGAYQLLFCVLLLHSSGLINLHYAKNDTRTRYSEKERKKAALRCFYQDYANMAATTKENRLKIRDNKFLLDDQPVKVSQKISSSVYTVQLQGDQSGKLTIPIYIYKGQIVEVDGKIRESTLSKYGSTDVQVMKGDKKITIYYEYTKLTKLSLLLSVGTLIILIIIMINDSRYSKKKNNLFYES